MAKRKSGQAAMEFLMTYGWAILVVLIVIGALAYFGILNPQSFLPKRCILGSGLSCVDAKLVDTGDFTIIITNSLGNPIQITALTLDDNSLQKMIGSCGGTFTQNVLPGENTPTLTVTGCNPGTGGAGFLKGGRVKAKISVTYTDQATRFEHTQVGEVIMDVE